MVVTPTDLFTDSPEDHEQHQRGEALDKSPSVTAHA
jgi:hypothetical protein